MKVFAILIEPAAYTLDRNRIIYEPRNISYCFLKNKSEASDNQGDKICLSQFPILKKIIYLNRILKMNDCVIINGYASIEFIILFALNLYHQKPVGIESDTPYSQPCNNLKRIIKTIYLNVVFRNINYFGWAGGTKNHKDLFTKFGMPEERVFLIPMMVDNEKFKCKNFDHKTINPFIFLYVGRFIELKNLRLLISAFLKFSKKHAETRLKMIGNGILFNELRIQYRKETQLVFTGALFNQDLTEIYNTGHVLILPSLYEPWGLVINEGLAAGLPVIVSDKVGSGYDLVIKPYTGLVFNAQDESELISCMEIMLNDKKAYKKMANNAYNHMNTYWNFELYGKCLDHALTVMYEKNITAKENPSLGKFQDSL